ncbi:MAG: NAD(P)H-hydrate dehydratase [Clostridia bacterium]|nr:NAD(P)H-hydrate dehydratase [Clostridia bacterium]
MSDMVITREYVKSLVGERNRDSHKGDNGRGLIIAGSDGFFGASLMATASCLKSGIGLLKTASVETARNAFFTLPEAMFCSIGASWDECDFERLSSLINEAEVIAVGPGIGKSRGVEKVLLRVLESNKNTVIDADGLNVLSMSDSLKSKLSPCVVLTPHFGEMSRLTGKSVEELSQNPKGEAENFAKEYNCNVLLKGAYSYIASHDGRVMKNESGNAGLAKGGSGDVLTGIILAMMGQKLSPFDAACAGAFILGTSADVAFDILKERMMLARDVTEAIEETLKWK